MINPFPRIFLGECFYRNSAETPGTRGGKAPCFTVLLAQASTGSNGDARRTSLQDEGHRCKIEHMSYAVKTFKYRLRPSRSQRTQLHRTLELCRWVYNETLATRKNTWEQEKKTLSLYDTNKLLTVLETMNIPNGCVSILRSCRMFRSEWIWRSRLSFVE